MPTATGPAFDIDYTVHGSGERPTVMLVCGSGQAADSWEGLVTALNDAGHPVVTFDNRGIAGAGCPTPPWTIHDMADDAIAVLEAIGPAFVGGASLGAMITQSIALRRPDLVRGVLFLFGGGNISPTHNVVMTACADYLAADEEIPKPLMDYFLLQALLTPEHRAERHMVDLVLSMAGSFSSSYGPGGELGQMRAGSNWGKEDHLEELAGLPLPLLAVAGEHDPAFPPYSLRKVVDIVKDGTYVEIPNQSHVALDPACHEILLNAILVWLGAQA